MTRTQPSQDSEYIAWAQNISLQCTDHSREWSINIETLTTLQTFVDNAKNAYDANINRETANHYTAVNKRESFKALKRFMSTFIMALVSNFAIPNAELVAMGLPSREHHAHEPLPVPSEAPEVTTIVGQHHDITIYVMIPQLGHPSEHLKKKGYHGFVLRYRKEDETDWREIHSTSLHTTLIFENDDEGKHIMLTAAWINPRIEHGPWSDELRVLIN
jgi:hypothetical protein